MLNYIYADFYRIFRKKSFYIFLAVCSLGFLSVVYIANNQGFDIGGYSMMVQVLMSLSPLLIGAFVFNIIYTDDLRSKSLQTAIGFGKKRSEIVAVKFLDASLLMILLGVIMGVHIFVVPMVLGLKVDDMARTFLFATIISEVIKTIGFFAIASIAVYFFQKTTAATTVYILLATGTVSSLLSFVLGQGFITNIVGDLQPYMFSNIVGSLNTWMMVETGNILLIIGQILVYIIGASVIASIAFNTKELEF